MYGGEQEIDDGGKSSPLTKAVSEINLESNNSGTNPKEVTEYLPHDSTETNSALSTLHIPRKISEMNTLISVQADSEANPFQVLPITIKQM